MKVIRGLEHLASGGPCAATIGTFDGVHKGHMAIIKRLKTVAAERGLCTSLVTFYPHPRLIVKGGIAPVRLLTSQQEKLNLLEAAGMDKVVIIPFDEGFSQTTYLQFVQGILLDKMNVQAVVVGYDHSFGRNREGNYTKLQALGEQLGFYTEQVRAVYVGEERIGSSRIRDLIKLGAVDQAAGLLGRLYSLSGTVVEGVARGRTLHFPTANLDLDYENKLLPENGVYAVDVIYKGKRHKGMLNIGYKPTFETGNAFSIEVHIHDFNADLYGQQLYIEFKKRLRSEKKFETKEALIAQLEIDKQLSLKL